MKCPLCGVGDKKYFTGSYLPHFILCRNCTGHFIESNIKTDYPRTYFLSGGQKSVISKIASPVLNSFYYLRFLKIKNMIKETSRVLDYGAGNGKFVRFLQKKGIRAFGFEPSMGAIEVAKKEGSDLASKLSDLEGKFDLIMFWHSLEHIGAPTEILIKVKKMLNRSGQILVAVPNADSFEARLFKEKWFHYTYPLHKFQFTPRSLKKMSKIADFRIKSIDYFNPEYTVSGLAQSFLNLLLPENSLYSVVSHRRIKGKRIQASAWSLLSILILIIFSPALLIFYLFELTFKKTDAIVLVLSK